MWKLRLGCLSVLCAVCLGMSACGSSGVDTDLISVDGRWLVKHDGFGCASLAGLLLENAVANLAQSGDDVSADFEDQAGNRYVVEGTYRNGILVGGLTVTTNGGRVVRVAINARAWTPPDETLAQLDGTLQMQFDSDDECAVGQRIGVWFLPSGSTDPGEVFSQCGPVDIVFVMDTSGSMGDEAAALCDQLDQVLADLEQLGLTEVRAFKWGINEDADSIVLAIQNASANGVIVSPIVGSGSLPSTVQHALNVAAGTAGVAVRSTGAQLDLGRVLFDIVFRACGGVVEPPVPPGPFVGATMLIAAGRDGGIYRIDPTTGATTFMTDTPINNVGDVGLRNVSSMVYNESAGQLWAGTGGEADCNGCIYRIDADGAALLLWDNNNSTDGELDAHPGLTYRRSDGVIFGTEGEDDDLWVLDNTTGAAAAYTEDMSDDLYEEGNGLTFVGDVLYWAGDDHLLRVDQFTGLGTDLGAFTFTNIEPPSSYTIVSMTSLPGSATIHAILKDRSTQPRATYVCTINVATRAITVLQPPAQSQVSTDTPLDGIAWVPADYFAPG